MQKRKKLLLSVLIAIMTVFYSGCNKNSEVDKSSEETEYTQTVTDTTVSKSDFEPTSQTETETIKNPEYAYVMEPSLSVSSGFYTKGFDLSMSSNPGTKIYYTLDGSTPTLDSMLYDKPIRISKKHGENPDAVIIRARAYAVNGVWSKDTFRTYFVSDDMDHRFTTAVISLIGDPKDFTKGPDGILYGDNANLRGDEYERPIHVTMWDENLTLCFSQSAGARAYGGASRSLPLKSLKLYARKSYDPLHGSFETDIFQTPSANGEGVITEYDKLVLRNGGNDFQFAYCRDELNQLMAKKAGMMDYEGVKSVVVYLNGSYYGFYFMHETYCDEYFVSKYAKKEDKGGEFVVLEGKDSKKYGGDDEFENSIVKKYNDQYKSFTNMDLNNPEFFDMLNRWMDVYNYLDYFAFNIYINNNDWPQNNYKCYAYIPAENEKPGEGAYDGRWRYLLHDLDYSLSIYEQNETMPDYDNLKEILDENSKRYAPLFAKLMEVPSCREYFRNKMISLGQKELSYDSYVEVLDSLVAERKTEMEHYLNYIFSMRQNRVPGIWVWPGHFENYVAHIKDFAKERSAYVLKMLEDNLPV